MKDISKQKDELLARIKDAYGITPDYLWARDPNSCALRHTDTGKWFGVIMKVKLEKIIMGASGEAFVLDVKCDPLMTGSILTNEGMYPAYHMNKKNWITIVLNGTVDTDEILMLIDMSYQITRPHKKTASVRRIPYWIVPVNNDYYDIDEAIRKHPETPLPWQMRYHFQQGDVVYLYVTSPVSAIKYKFMAEKVEELEGKGKNRIVYLKYVREYDTSVFTFGTLKEYGVYAVRGARSIPMELVKAIEEYEADGN